VFDTVGAIIALGSGSGIWVDVKGVIRTRLHTCLTAYTTRVIEINNAIFTGEKSGGRANCCAWGILTVITAVDAEFTIGIRIGSSLDILNVSSVNSDWHIVFRLTSDGTSVAAYAGAIIDDKAIIHHIRLTP